VATSGSSGRFEESFRERVGGGGYADGWNQARTKAIPALINRGLPRMGKWTGKRALGWGKGPHVASWRPYRWWSRRTCWAVHRAEDEVVRLKSRMRRRSCSPPIGPESQEGDPEESITILDPGPFRLALEHLRLVTERGALQDEVALSPQRRSHKSAQAADHLPHQCSLHLTQRNPNNLRADGVLTAYRHFSSGSLPRLRPKPLRHRAQQRQARSSSWIEEQGEEPPAPGIAARVRQWQDRGRGFG